MRIVVLHSNHGYHVSMYGNHGYYMWLPWLLYVVTMVTRYGYHGYYMVTDLLDSGPPQ